MSIRFIFCLLSVQIFFYASCTLSAATKNLPLVVVLAEILALQGTPCNERQDKYLMDFTIDDDADRTFKRKLKRSRKDMRLDQMIALREEWMDELLYLRETPDAVGKRILNNWVNGDRRITVDAIDYTKKQFQPSTIQMLTWLMYQKKKAFPDVSESRRNQLNDKYKLLESGQAGDDRKRKIEESTGKDGGVRPAAEVSAKPVLKKLKRSSVIVPNPGIVDVAGQSDKKPGQKFKNYTVPKKKGV